MEVEPSTLTTHKEGLVVREATATAAAAGGGYGSKGDPIAGGLKDRDPKKWSEVSRKSVILARQERDSRGVAERQGTGGDTEAGELRENEAVPTKKGISGAGGGGQGTSDEGGAGVTVARQGGNRVMQATEASAMRQHARRREDEFLAGGAQNFYKTVRVCASCFRVRR